MEKPIFNTLEFDGINSKDYGIFITGEAIYDAPERDVEVIEVAGRNGDILLDNGRWKNIAVTYKAGTFGADQDEFASKLRAFRSALASRIGYKRIVDTYHPDEYRIGAFIAPLEVDTVSRKRAGEFDIEFNCKPHRYLMSGEAPVTVTNGMVLSNPTPCEASPLLAIWGYGDVGFNGYNISLENAMMGNVEVAAPRRVSNGEGILLNMDVMNAGDTVTIGETKVRFVVQAIYSNRAFTEVTSVSPTFAATVEMDDLLPLRISGTLTLPSFSMASTASAYKTGTVTIEYKAHKPNGDIASGTIRVHAEIRYGGSHSILPTVTIENTLDEMSNATVYNFGGAYADSTVSLLGNPTYIDCDLGDAYIIKNGSPVSLNRYIDLGSELPVLASGQNTVTFSNTVTKLEITPRWKIL